MPPTLRDIFKPGITGCTNVPGGHATPHDQSTLKQWKSACHAWTTSIGGHVAAYTPSGLALNFHTIRVECPPRALTNRPPAPNTPDDAVIELLAHSLLPYAAARVIASSRLGATFVECPLDPSHLPQGWLMLPPDLLNESFHPEPWMRDIDPAAWRDFIHWRPERIGDLVFNTYD